MLTINLCVPFGLFNVAIGIVEDILYFNGRKPPTCQGMTIGDGEVERYIVINPGTRAFESRNPGALFVAISRAKYTGKDNTDPDFAWHP